MSALPDEGGRRSGTQVTHPAVTTPTIMVWKIAAIGTENEERLWDTLVTC